MVDYTLLRMWKQKFVLNVARDTIMQKLLMRLIDSFDLIMR